MRCRQQWAWGSFNREAFQPLFAKPALATGHLWHQVMAEWALKPTEHPSELCLTLANQEIDAVSKAYLERIGAPISPIELESYYGQVGLVMNMVKNYYDHWGMPLPEGFSLVSPEQTCVIPIPGTEHTCDTCGGSGTWEDGSNPRGPCPTCTGNGSTPHYLAGTLDALISDTYGRVYVLERKTYGQRPKIEVLNMQDQFLAYLWIVRELGIGEVGGLAYDGAWKREVPPKGSILKDLFLRVLLTRNSIELDRFTFQLRDIVLDMANSPAIYPNRRWDGCWDCDFVEPCIAQERGEDFHYIFDTKFTRRPREEDSTRDLKYTESTA